MHASTLSAAAFLALAHRAVALGSANVKNMCSYPVYLESVSQQAGSMQTLAANGGAWSQTWLLNPDGGGLSIKMSNTQSMSSITQFEYTVANGLWYDISNINGYPFEGHGLSVNPSSSGCRVINCPENGVCNSAYNQPDDNEATAYCDENSNMDIVLCPDGGDSGSSSSQSPPSSQPKKQAAPTPTITQAPNSSPAVATTVQIHTTLVTQVVTLEAGPDGTVFFGIDKRDTARSHEHRNAHGNHARYHRHAEQE